LILTRKNKNKFNCQPEKDFTIDAFTSEELLNILPKDINHNFNKHSLYFFYGGMMENSKCQWHGMKIMICLLNWMSFFNLETGVEIENCGETMESQLSKRTLSMINNLKIF
jgi:hypothetical protein